MPSPLTLGLSVLISSLTYILITRIFFHPLSSIPGPFPARISKLYIIYHIRKGRSDLLFPSLHATYGPIVRIAPNQVSVCDGPAIRLAYSAGTRFTKGSWYQVCAAPKKGSEEGLDLLPETNIEKYRMQRRAIGPAYSIKGMEKHEGVLSTYLETFISRLQGFNGKELDLALWTHIYALDALSWFVLGKSLDYTAQGHDGGNLEASDSIWSIFTTLGWFPTYVDVMRSIPKIGGLLIIPASLALGLGMPKMWPIITFAAPSVLGRLQGLESTRNVRWYHRLGAHRTSEHPKQPLEKEEVEVGEEKDLLATLMTLHHDKEARFKPGWVLGITMTNFGAGHDTVMITLAGMLYHLAKNQEYVARLRQEMQEQDVTKDVGYVELTSKVPLFSAILKESLRLIPAVSGFLPRVVPDGGADVCGTYLPAGTTMGICQWATHHDPSLFPEPERFWPERWMNDGTEEKKKEIGRMDHYWMGFGSANRSCPGQNLGRFFVIKAVKRIIEEFDVEVTGKMEIIGWFATGMRDVGVKFILKTTSATI